MTDPAADDIVTVCVVKPGPYAAGSRWCRSGAYLAVLRHQAERMEAANLVRYLRPGEMPEFSTPLPRAVR